MRGLRYLDFDLLFQRADHGYLARVIGSPAGQATSEFMLPFSDLEIENFLLRFGRSRQPMRRLGTSQIDAARAFGGRLFEATFQSEVRSCLRSSLDEAQRQEMGLRLRLRLADTPELNDLPWEFLLQPSLGRFLALSAETPLVRYLDLPERVRPLAVKPPLEVLTVISSPSNYASLDVELEWRKLSESLEELQARGFLRLHRLPIPTLTHLQRWLRRETCHILHFIGHGGFDARTEEGLLVFSDEAGKGREVSGAALGTLLHDHRSLRLAVLNACEGARSSRSDPFAGVAQSLVREGVPAVVAMQFEITDCAAIEFAYELYAAVVDGYPIDAALGEARKALYFAGHELEWGTPVLYMRSPDGQLFEISPAAVESLRLSPSRREAEPKGFRREVPAPLDPTYSEGPIPIDGSKETAGSDRDAQERPLLVDGVEDEVEGRGGDGEGVSAVESLAALKDADAPPSERVSEALSEEPENASEPESLVAETLPPPKDRPWAPNSTEPRPDSVRETEERLATSEVLRAGQWIGWAALGMVIVASLYLEFGGPAVLLAAIGWVAIGYIAFNARERARKDERNKAPAPAEVPLREILTPSFDRVGGLYLKAAVKRGEPIQPFMLEIVGGSWSPHYQPQGLDDVVGGCFTSDFDEGHKLAWGDIGECT